MKRWPEIRAGLIAIAIGFGLVDGCPLPPPDKTPAWERGFVEPIRSVQQTVLTPVAWIRWQLRVTQRWSLYQGPRPDRTRMSIEGQEPSGQWRILFRASDPAHAEDAELLDYTRPRGTWDPGQKPPLQYPLFAQWVTGYMLDKHPELIAARVRFETVHLGDPASGVTPSGKFLYPFVRTRGAR